jgi:predicted Fe-S protein YdhL (DUF1289 family)
MQQLEFFEIPSPCIGVCQTADNGFCLGCYRSRDERLYWMKIDSEVKRKIVKACYRRKKRAQAGQVIEITESILPHQSSLWDHHDS